MYCSKCGSELHEGAAFCAICGELIGNRNVEQDNNVSTQFRTGK